MSDKSNKKRLMITLSWPTYDKLCDLAEQRGGMSKSSYLSMLIAEDAEKNLRKEENA